MTLSETSITRKPHTRKPWKTFAAAVIVLVATAGSTVAYTRRSAAERLRADIRTHAPIGSSRQSVDEYLRFSGLRMGIAAFDYPEFDPRQGTLIIGSVPEPEYLRSIRLVIPAFETRGPYFVLYFDHKGPDGNLIRYNVSNKPIQVAPP
jgi:hypothetical protein